MEDEKYYCDVCGCEISAEDDHRYEFMCFDCFDEDRKAFWNSLTDEEKEKIIKGAIL